MSEHETADRRPRATRVLRKAAGTLATGVTGVLAVRLIEGVEPGTLPRKVAVRVTRWGIVGARRAEAAVERARLAAGDIRAAAYAQLGEQAPPPSTRSAEPHGHAH
ncbi:uncharacterized protein DUF1490 [Blastococcus colisei]|uniref:Uncharacterized protein DUF1490 n=1 Tax=Blastococcus colisei TaxID=1564162 RepID=A0A543PHZ0_9ACTN|nr:DUF1490 family protein [Blastococcus colisei]TQN43706.1 uncharacterized protein DUF1490 [Blastococcus colisei]